VGEFGSDKFGEELREFFPSDFPFFPFDFSSGGFSASVILTNLLSRFDDRDLSFLPLLGLLTRY
jgi:hypothetical protein